MSESDRMEAATGREIAVVGMSGRFPGARDLSEFWRQLAEGREAVTFFSDGELRAAGVPEDLLADPQYVKAGSVLEDVDCFDAGFFGYSARDAQLLDPQQRLFLEHAWEALEDAGCVPGTFEGLIGVYAGVAWNTYLLRNLVSHRELFDGAGGFQVFISNDKDFMPTRVSYKLDLKGPSMILQTSCSTSLVGVHMGCLSLTNYECDVALVGGSTVKVPQVQGYYFQEGGLASPDGHCRAFDEEAAGTIFGSGVGVVVLKRLDEALADGDRIRAVIRGSAINNDGSVKVSYTAPSVEGQAEVIAAAQEVAGVEPETIRYLETHGTGTSLGDPIEVTALTRVFREATEKQGFCALGSVKTNVGHLDAAAGIAGFIKTVLALEHRQIPPSLNFERPNPALDLEASPFYVSTELHPWEGGGSPRRAGVSSFGVGGTNAHVVLEEAPAPEPSGVSRPWQLLVLSARSEEALGAATEALREHLEVNPELDDAARFADAAWTLKTGRAVFHHRRVLVASDRLDALAALAGGAAGRLATAADREKPRGRPVVFLFPGQGTQRPGMGRELYAAEPVFRRELDRCLELLEPRLDTPLRPLLLAEGEPDESAADSLTTTALAQPALFAVEVALARLWMSWGVVPTAMIGHSIGELTAAHLAGVLSLEDAAALVAERGLLMQRQPPGAMLAVPLPEEELPALLPPEVSVAAVNEPSRCVASGPEPAVAELEAVLGERGVSARRLRTSHAFHSAMMEPAVPELVAAVRRLELRPPQVPWVSNVSGTWITPEQATDPEYWGRHLRGTVRFARGVEELLADPERVLLEVGPGRTLSTLVGRHPARREQPVIASLPHPRQGDPEQASMLEALGRLWLAGLDLDWRLFYEGERRRKVALPTYPFERGRYWIEPAHGNTATPRAAMAPEIAGGAPAKGPDPARWLYLPAFRRAPRPAAAQPRQRWLVFADRGGFGAALTAHLRGAGRRVVTVEAGPAGEGLSRRGDESWVLAPGDRQGYAELLAEVEGEEGAPDAVVHAWTVGSKPSAPSSAKELEAVFETGFYSLLYLIQALGAAVRPVDLTVVADRLLQVTAGEPLAAEKAPLLGLLTVLPDELPQIGCRAIDLGPPVTAATPEVELDRQARRVIAEIESGAADGAIALRGSQRWVESFEAVAAPVEPEAVPLRQGGVYLLTGGLAGNGLALARYLVRELSARLVLVEDEVAAVEGGTDDLGDDERRRRLRSLEEMGAEVRVVTADLIDPESLEWAVREAEEGFGALHGVIHAAGTQGQRTFRVLGEADRETCRWHFRPRAQALFALEQALSGRELDFVVLLSSLATVLGGVAYGPYAAANRFMDAFVRQRAGRSALPWRSLGWDVWELEDEREQILDLRQDLAALAMTPREGEAVFRAALALPDADHVLVSTADLAVRLAHRRSRIESRRGRLEVPPGGGSAQLHPRPSLPVPYVAPESDLERRIAAVWGRVLGFAQIGAEDNFFDLGGDSFIAVQVVEKMKRELGTDLPVAQLYQGLTVRSLAALLEGSEAKAEERAAQLTERREAMDRRRELFERRRTRKAKNEVKEWS